MRVFLDRLYRGCGILAAMFIVGIALAILAEITGRMADENYYLPGDLENQISAFVDHYNNQRYHESIGNVTPADAYFGRHTAIIEKRKKIKKLTTQNRRLNHPCLSGYHPHPLYVVCLLGLQARAGAGALRRRSG